MKQSPGGVNPERSDAGAKLPLVALVGRVNVGKSTLFNRLLRERRALVEDRPGVTRDRLVAETEIEGRDVLLVDTGGLDPDAEAGLPRAIAAQVRRVVEDASVILLVVDARAGLLPLDRHIARVLRRAARAGPAPRDPALLVVANKADSPELDAAAAEFHALGLAGVVAVSAEHRRGIADLEIEVAQRLPPQAAPAPRDAGLRIAIVGRPNVGKSSLLNRLLGEERAIVSEEPGTTRDPTDTELRISDPELGERAVVLIDTAGLRRQGRRSERLERGSALMALRSIERAELVLLLLDASEGVSEQDAKIARLALDRGRTLVLVWNKWDTVKGAERGAALERERERKLGFVPHAEVLRVSARTGRGTGQVLSRALRLDASVKRSVPTAELNRALREAVARNAPPAGGRRPPRLYYATQTAERPLTILVFVSDPARIPESYRRYLVSFMRERFGIRSAPVRVRLRRRPRRSDGEVPDADAGERSREPGPG